jgi:hypothetical protein
VSVLLGRAAGPSFEFVPQGQTQFVVLAVGALDEDWSSSSDKPTAA